MKSSAKNPQACKVQQATFLHRRRDSPNRFRVGRAAADMLPGSAPPRERNNANCHQPPPPVHIKLGLPDQSCLAKCAIPEAFTTSRQLSRTHLYWLRTVAIVQPASLDPVGMEVGTVLQAGRSSLICGRGSLPCQAGCLDAESPPRGLTPPQGGGVLLSSWWSGLDTKDGPSRDLHTHMLGDTDR